jgi:hypothetical protein
MLLQFFNQIFHKIGKAVVPSFDNALLMESGSSLLLESGEEIALESQDG